MEWDEIKPLVTFSENAADIFAKFNNWYYWEEYMERMEKPQNWLINILLVVILFITAINYFAYNTFLKVKNLCCKKAIKKLGVD